jgi:hypothetical protein
MMDAREHDDETERLYQAEQTRRYSRLLWTVCGVGLVLKLTALAVVIMVS